MGDSAVIPVSKESHNLRRCHVPKRSAVRSPRLEVGMAAGTNPLLLQKHANKLRPCKNRKIKCGEEKPNCWNCDKQGDTCDYSIRLNWFRSDSAHLSPSLARPALATRSLSEGENPLHSGTAVMEPVVRERAWNASLPQQVPPISSSSPPQRPDTGHKRHYSAGSGPASTRYGRSPEQVKKAIDPAVTSTACLPVLAQYTSGTESNVSANGSLQKPVAGFRDHMSASQLSRLRAACPSPANSSIECPAFFATPSSAQGFSHQSQMPPPHQGPAGYPPSLTRRYPDHGGEHRSKRVRLGTALNPSEYLVPSREFSFGEEVSLAPSFSPYFPDNGLYSPWRYPGSVSMPAASTPLEDYIPALPARPAMVQDNNDFRRLSVKSLLSDDAEQPDSSGESALPPLPTDPCIHHGVDRGFPDLDIPRNNDAIALNGITPALSTSGLYRDGSVGEADEPSTQIEFGFGLYSSDTAHSEGGYYAKAVPVSIPRSLGILPSTLQDNPMNLLYFHHFIDHVSFGALIFRSRDADSETYHRQPASWSPMIASKTPFAASSPGWHFTT